MVIPVVFFEFQEMAIMQDLAPFASDLPCRGGQGPFPSMRAYHLKPDTPLEPIQFSLYIPSSKNVLFKIWFKCISFGQRLDSSFDNLNFLYIMMYVVCSKTANY